MSDFFHSHIGEFAGVATALLWTGTSLFFSAAGRRIGPTAVNTSRLILAIGLLAVTHRAWSGIWVPEMNDRQLAYLAISGVIGLAIGDQALFTALVDIGPRLSTLIMTTSPLFAAWFGYLALDERLGPMALVGMVLTIGGVAWAVLERSTGPSPYRSAHLWRGAFLALIGAICQGGGLLLSKQGMGHGSLPPEARMDPQAATLVRAVFATAGMIPFILVRHYIFRRRHVNRAARTGRTIAVGYMLAGCGAVVGPYLGVWMSLVAGDRAPVGVAQTICSMTPIFVLPAVAIIHREHISVRAIIGALLAVGGCAVLFMR